MALIEALTLGKKTKHDLPFLPRPQEEDWISQLYDKYVPFCIDMIVEGLVDGKQGEKMKTIVPLTNLNMVSTAV